MKPKKSIKNTFINKNGIHSHENMQKSCKTLKNYIYLPEFYNKDIIILRIYKTKYIKTYK